MRDQWSKSAVLIPIVSTPRFAATTLCFVTIFLVVISGFAQSYTTNTGVQYSSTAQHGRLVQSDQHCIIQEQ